MSEDTTAIHVVLDRSGSMGRVTSDVIGGFNTFLKEQKAEKGKATISLAQFDNVYEVVYDSKPLSKAPDLDEKTYVPRASTALLDAVGRTISAYSAKFVKMSKAKRPGKVLFLIMTDGLENASSEYTKEQVAKLIKEHEEKNEWKFVFIGASMDSMREAQGIGMAKGNMLNANMRGSAGVQAMYSSVSSATSAYRGKSRELARSAGFFGPKDKPKKPNPRERASSRT